MKRILAHWEFVVVDSLTTPQTVLWLQKQKHGERTVEIIRRVFGTMLQYGKLIGANRDNPLAGVRFKRKSRPKQRRIAEEKLEATLAHKASTKASKSRN